MWNKYNHSLNRISDNSNNGIFIDNGNNNEFFYNEILFNQKQAIDHNTNQWDNGNNEGNFWSDYTGLDNGSGGRVADDGIGDTNIPHLDLDNFPFIKQNGWYLIDPPKLHDPGNINNTGTYEITWDHSLRAQRYFVEEDSDISFPSPDLIYMGPSQSIELTDKINGTYYYRVMIITELVNSPWSNVVDIMVDLPPIAPTGLAAINSTGRNITLSWLENTELDLLGYHIFINNSLTGPTGPFHWIMSVDNNTSQWTVTGLAEETIYYFKIKAFDGILSNSTFSNVASNTTLDETAPAAPSELTATAISNIEIKLTFILMTLGMVQMENFYG
jgi:hypothetical protein